MRTWVWLNGAMKSLALHVFVYGWVFAYASALNSGCFKDVQGPWPNFVVSKLPHEYVDPTTLPLNFDWTSVNGTCYVSAVTTQFIPWPCGSCWAHASTGALTDRFIIATGGKLPFVRLSPQVLLDLATDAGSCDGGSQIMAYKFIFEHGITDITCAPSMGTDHFYWAELPLEQMMCRTADRFGGSKFINGTRYFVSEYGSVLGEEMMMAEIFARGPIACSLYAHSPSFEEYTGGIIQDPTQYNGTTHVVTITGWGVNAADGMKYWVGRNSFGTSWGEAGWFLLQRGVNCLNMEKAPCAWATPSFKQVKYD